MFIAETNQAVQLMCMADVTEKSPDEVKSVILAKVGIRYVREEMALELTGVLSRN